MKLVCHGPDLEIVNIGPDIDSTIRKNKENKLFIDFYEPLHAKGVKHNGFLRERINTILTRCIEYCMGRVHQITVQFLTSLTGIDDLSSLYSLVQGAIDHAHVRKPWG